MMERSWQVMDVSRQRSRSALSQFRRWRFANGFDRGVVVRAELRVEREAIGQLEAAERLPDSSKRKSLDFYVFFEFLIFGAEMLCKGLQAGCWQGLLAKLTALGTVYFMELDSILYPSRNGGFAREPLNNG
jgi:hypothetical protein